MKRTSTSLAAVGRPIGFAAAAAALLLPLSARAQPVDGPYVSLGAGYNWLTGETVKSISVNGNRILATGSSAAFEGGFVGLGALGWGFGNGLRVEVEGDYRYNDLHSVTGATDVTGHEYKYGAMANALYDFDFGWPVVPYLGAGVGFQSAGIAGGGLTYPGAPGSFIRLDHPQLGFAYQAIAGVALPLPLPGLSASVEYRFMGVTGDRQIYGQYFSGPIVGPANARFSGDDNHSVLLGLRYAFNQPAAPPPPAPVSPVQVPPTRSYLVFFDWDKATLTDRARQIIREAADASTHVQYTRIEVNGYTDTSGTPAYNQGLSVRRAQAVADELVRDGEPREAITIQGFGETHLLVPTGPGVREPQNRRVEIIIS